MFIKHQLLLWLSLLVSQNALSKEPSGADEAQLRELESGVGELIVIGHRCNVFFVNTSRDTKTKKFALTSSHCLPSWRPGLTLSSPIKGVWRGPTTKSVWVDFEVEKKGTNVAGDDWALLSYKPSKETEKLYKSNVDISRSYREATSEYVITKSGIKECAFEAMLLTSKANVVRFKDCVMKEGLSGSPYYGYYEGDDALVLLGIVKSKHKKRDSVGYYVTTKSFIPFLD